MIISVSTPEEFSSCARDLEAYSWHAGSRLGLDFETYHNIRPVLKKSEDPEDDEEQDDGVGVPRPLRNADGSLKGHIRLMQIATDPDLPGGDRVFVIDVKALGYDIVREGLKSVLERCTILGQNLKYEWQFAFQCFGIRLGCKARAHGRKNALLDVMLMSQVLFAGDKVHHGLGHLYGRFFDPGWFFARTGKTFDLYQQFKEAQQQADWGMDVLTPDMNQYAADDAWFMFPLVDKIREKIREWMTRWERHLTRGGMSKVIQLEQDLIPVFALMELRGIKIDVNYQRDVVLPYLQKKKDEASARVGWNRTVTKRKTNGKRGLKKEVWEETRTEVVNLGSWQQLKPRLNELISNALGKPFEIEGTGEDVIKEVINRHKDDLSAECVTVLRDVLQFKKANSLLSKFGPKMLDLASDRCYLHPGWFQIGTDSSSVSSGRCSCKAPNMMQMPSRGDHFVTKRDEKLKPIFTFDEKGFPLDGVNAMQFFRQAFVAEEGWDLVDADFSAEEPRIAADYCNEHNMIAEFHKPGKVDVHSIAGKAMMGLKYYPKKGEYERDYIGKTAGLQLLYGAYWKSLKQFLFLKTDGVVDLSDKEAKALYDNYFAEYPEFKRQMIEDAEEMSRLAEDAGQTLAPFKVDRQPFAVAWTYFGRARRFCLSEGQCRMSDKSLGIRALKPLFDKKTKLPLLDENGEQIYTKFNTYKERLSSAGREGFNHVIQGTAADILKFAILNIHNEFEAAGFDWSEGIVGIIHDEILLHVKSEHAVQAKRILERCMKEAFEMFITKVPCEVDVKKAKTWAEAKG